MATKKIVLSKERSVNLQRPFSFDRARLPKRVVPVNYKLAVLPVNIKALCTGCGLWYQKLTKPTTKTLKTTRRTDPFSGRLYDTFLDDQRRQVLRVVDRQTPPTTTPDTPTPAPISRCIKCSARVIALPENLRPWRLLPPTNAQTQGPTPFACPICHSSFFSWAFFGSLCSHKTHRFPKCVCRFCCPKITTESANPVEEHILAAPPGRQPAATVAQMAQQMETRNRWRPLEQGI